MNERGFQLAGKCLGTYARGSLFTCAVQSHLSPLNMRNDLAAMVCPAVWGARSFEAYLSADSYSENDLWAGGMPQPRSATRLAVSASGGMGAAAP